MNLISPTPSRLQISLADLAWVFVGGLVIAAAINVSVSLMLPPVSSASSDLFSAQNGYLPNAHLREAVLGLIFGVLAYGAFLVALYFRLVRRRGATLQMIGLQYCESNFVVMGFLAALLWLCITAVLYTGIGLWDITLAQGRALFTPFLASPWSFVLFCVLAGPLAALTEELLFRGLLFRWLRQRWSFLPSALLSGLIFALIHPYLYVDSPALFMAFLFDLVAISVVLAFLYEISKSLWPAIIAHASNNLLLIAVQFYAG